MIADHFDTTFPGKQWINLIRVLKADKESIENGRSLAERESVNEITFEKHRLNARIDDSGEVVKTTIMFDPFSSPAKTKLMQFIRNKRNILPDTSFSILPEEFYTELTRNKIFLIPENVKNISTECSCGWNLCRHVTALIYSSAVEVEKNPSVLFLLRGFDLKTVFHEKSTDSGIIKFQDMNSLFMSYKKLHEPPRPSEKVAGFHIDSVNILSIFKLLPEKPLFYSREDFRTLLLEKYKAYASFAADYPIEEHTMIKSLSGHNFHLTYYAEGEINGSEEKSIFNSSGYYPAFLLNRALPNIKIIKEVEVKIPEVTEENIIKLNSQKMKRVPYTDILKHFLSIPLELSVKNNSVTSRFLNAASTVALLLIKSYAYIPEVRFLNNEEFIVAFCPLAANSSIEKALSILKDMTPHNFVLRNSDSAIMKDNIHIHLLQLFLDYIITSYEKKFGRKHYFSDQKMYNTFFKGEVFRPEKYDEYQNGLQAALWLEKLSNINLNTKPVLIFNAKEDEYEFNLFIKDNSNEKLITLSELFLISQRSGTSDAIRARVIRQLNAASEYFPEILSVVDNQGSISGILSAKEMYSFIKKTEPLLSLLGIVSDIPSEMNIRNTPKAILTARLKNFSGLNARIDIKNLVEFEWKISIGERLIPVDEYFKLVSQDEGLLNINGTYFINDHSNNENLMQQVGNKIPDKNSQGLLKLLLSGEFNGNKIFTETELDEFLHSIFDVEDTEIPEGLNTELRHYQVSGFNWLYSKLKKGFGVCLADDMGLGKTVQVIAVLLKFKKEKFNKLPVLIVCPTSLVANWYKELERFAPGLRVFIYHGSRRRFELNKHDIILTTYGIIRNETEKFRKYHWDIIIIDEAQNIKNWESEQARSVKSLDSQLHLAISGTPIENRLTELWSIFDFIIKDYLGTYKDFRSNYAIPIEKYGDTDKLAKLRQITSPFILRRLKSDPNVINDLPDKLELDEYCYLTNEQMQLYKNTITEVFNQITHSNKNERSGYILSLITKLKQVCNHPSLLTKEKNIDYRLSGKTEKLVDLVAGFLDRHEKCLIFTQYKEMGQMICTMLKYEFNTKPLFFHGSLATKKRDLIVEQFQNSSQDMILIVSIKAGGTGLNLTAAERVIHFDLWWNPAVETQASDRTYRIGQDKNVTIHRLISINTFEEKIDKMLKQKKELADLAVISGEPSLYKLSNKELKQLFKLD